MPEVPVGLPPQVVKSPLNLFRSGRSSPRRHLRNLISSRTSNGRAMRVVWSWFQGAKRGLPEIPAEFILAAKVKHAKALQKELPPIPADFLAHFRHDLKDLWRGLDKVSTRSFRDEEGNIKTALIRQWKLDRAVRHWQGNPGWNACTPSTRSDGGKTNAARQAAFVSGSPDSHSASILPRVPMDLISSWGERRWRADRCACGSSRDPRATESPGHH